MNEEFKPAFIQIPRELICDKRLAPNDRIVYGVIFWYEKLKDGVCKASNKSISIQASCSESAAANSISKLSKFGYIECLYYDENKKSRYQILTTLTQMSKRVYSNEEQNNNINNKERKREKEKTKVPTEVQLDKECALVLETYNTTFGKKVRSSNGFRSNLLLWRKDYDLDTILSSLQNSKHDQYWGRIIGQSLDTFFRRRNPYGEPTDYIAKFMPQEEVKNILVDSRGREYELYDDGVHPPVKIY